MIDSGEARGTDSTGAEGDKEETEPEVWIGFFSIISVNQLS